MLLGLAKRSGIVTVEFQAPPGRNTITLVMGFTPPSEPVRFRFTIEQTDGEVWWVLGGAELSDVRKTDEDGQPVTSYAWRFTEQLVRSDECVRRGYASTRSYQINEQTYKHLALCVRQRLTIETDNELEYSIDTSVVDRPYSRTLSKLIGGGG